MTGKWHNQRASWDYPPCPRCGYVSPVRGVPHKEAPSWYTGEKGYFCERCQDYFASDYEPETYYG